MTKDRKTPGPWYVWFRRGPLPPVGRGVFAVQQGSSLEDSHLQTVAYVAFKGDARLIALAPELLGALRHVVDGDMCDHPNHEKWLWDLVRKAEGKPPKEMRE